MGRTTAENPQPSDLRERGTYRSTQFIKGMKAERSLMGLISANPVAILPVHIEKMFHQIRVNTLRLISSVTTLSTGLHRCVRDYSTEFCKYELVCERKTEFDGLRHMQSTFDKAARVVSKISF
ncbi:Tyrosine-protein phosphatase 69D [Trichinella pseudospiralis]